MTEHALQARKGNDVTPLIMDTVQLIPSTPRSPLGDSEVHWVLNLLAGAPLCSLHSSTWVDNFVNGEGHSKLGRKPFGVGLETPLQAEVVLSSSGVPIKDRKWIVHHSRAASQSVGSALHTEDSAEATLMLDLSTNLGSNEDQAGQATSKHSYK